MFKFLKFGLLAVLIASFCALAQQRDIQKATAHRGAKISQRQNVTFPEIGIVQVRAIETPDRLPHLEIKKISSGELIFKIELGTSDPIAFKPDLQFDWNISTLRFKPIPVSGFSGPLILAVAEAPRGSDTAFEAKLIGLVNGKFKALTKHPMSTDCQGGYFIGDLGKGKGIGIAQWDFIWGDGPGEGHYAAHRYEVTFYRWDSNLSEFVKSKTLKSRRRHETWRGAMKELGFSLVNLRDSVVGRKSC